VVRRLGYLPEEVPLYVELSVDENLAFCARLYGLRGAKATQAVNRVIDQCGLGTVRRRLFGNLSKGFQQRAGIAQALVHSPDLIVLDEPASGLDPLQATQIRALMRELGRECAVILSTHLLPDVQACCDRVAILHQGRLRYDGPLQVTGENNVVHVTTVAVLDAEKFKTLACVCDAAPVEGAWRIRLVDGATPARLADAIVARGWGLQELRSDTGNLEQVFLRVASADETQVAA